METLDWSLSWGMRKGTHCSYCVVLLCGVVYVYNHDVVHVQCCCVSSAFHSCPCELWQQWVSFMSHAKTSCCGKLLCHFLHCSPSLVLHCRTHADTQTFDMHYMYTHNCPTLTDNGCSTMIISLSLSPFLSLFLPSALPPITLTVIQRAHAYAQC